MHISIRRLTTRGGLRLWTQLLGWKTGGWSMRFAGVPCAYTRDGEKTRRKRLYPIRILSKTYRSDHNQLFIVFEFLIVIMSAVWAKWLTQLANRSSFLQSVNIGWSLLLAQFFRVKGVLQQMGTIPATWTLTASSDLSDVCWTVFFFFFTDISCTRMSHLGADNKTE